jgi:LysM repeat protein
VSVETAGDFAFSWLYGDNVILASEKPLQENAPSILTDIQRRNTMGIFGKSFDQKVQEAVAALGRSGLGVRGLTATVAGKVVTLEGEVDTMEAKGRVMSEFNKLVDTENTINRIRVKESPAAPQAPPPAAPKAAEETTYVVQSGDTLGALAQRFYGKASLYPKIFEANRDILSDPNLIKVGQKLRIPK